MHATKRWGAIVAVVAIAFGTAGCFEVEEWVRIAPTGLTNLTMKIRIGITEKDKKGLRKTPADEAKEKVAVLGEGMAQFGVRLKGVTADERNGQTIVATEAEADRLGAFEGFYKTLTKAQKEWKGGKGGPDVSEVFMRGSFYRAKRAGDRIRITRTLLPTAKPEPKKKKGGESMDDMGEMILGGIFMRFALTVPGQIVAHNAETVDGQTLMWIYPLNHVSTKKVEMWAEVEATPEVEAALLK